MLSMKHSAFQNVVTLSSQSNLQVARVTGEIGAEQVTCLTATATPRVAEYIRNTFNIKKRNLASSPYRPNLELPARAVRLNNDKISP